MQDRSRLDASLLCLESASPSLLSPSDLLKKLDLATLVPVHCRIEAAAQLQCHFDSLLARNTSHETLIPQVEACSRVLISSLLRAPEDLAESIVDLLTTLSVKIAPWTNVKIWLLQLAEAEVRKHGGQYKPAALLSLLAIVLRDKDADAVAAALCDRKYLLDCLVFCVGLVNAEVEQDRQAT
ncbi:MAG: hypothetical protein SGPRY_004468 [Prymnesium sp.]